MCSGHHVTKHVVWASGLLDLLTFRLELVGASVSVQSKDYEMLRKVSKSERENDRTRDCCM